MPQVPELLHGSVVHYGIDKKRKRSKKKKIDWPLARNSKISTRFHIKRDATHAINATDFTL